MRVADTLLDWFMDNYFHVTQLGDIISTAKPIGEMEWPSLTVTNCPDEGTALWCWRSRQATLLDEMMVRYSAG